MWVATEILSTPNDKQRGVVIGNFIQLLTVSAYHFNIEIIFIINRVMIVEFNGVAKLSKFHQYLSWFEKTTDYTVEKELGRKYMQ